MFRGLCNGSWPIWQPNQRRQCWWDLGRFGLLCYVEAAGHNQGGGCVFLFGWVISSTARKKYTVRWGPSQEPIAGFLPTLISLVIVSESETERFSLTWIAKSQSIYVCFYLDLNNFSMCVDWQNFKLPGYDNTIKLCQQSNHPFAAFDLITWCWLTTSECSEGRNLLRLRHVWWKPECTKNHLVKIGTFLRS